MSAHASPPDLRVGDYVNFYFIFNKKTNMYSNFEYRILKISFTNNEPIAFVEEIDNLNTNRFRLKDLSLIPGSRASLWRLFYGKS